MSSSPETPAALAPRSLDEALALMKDLRARCDWDRVQTHQSLRPYLIEEAHDEPRPLPLEWRFVHPKTEDWSPFNSRFQRADWMKWPARPTPSPSGQEGGDV